eukprot:392679_1
MLQPFSTYSKKQNLLIFSFSSYSLKQTQTLLLYTLQVKHEQNQLQSQMNISRGLQRALQRKTLHRGVYPLRALYPTATISKRYKPVAQPYKFNVIQRKGHGPVHYYREWEALLFSRDDWTIAGLWLNVLMPIVFVSMCYSFFNSLWRDPEVRWRPHKKAWHLEDERAKKANYRYGSYAWWPLGRYNPDRVRWWRQIFENGLPWDEPGQCGYEELAIPSLDE